MPFQIVRNDITRMAADAIVSTTDPLPAIGAGTDAMIHEAAGPGLLTARQQIGQIDTGCAAITPSFGLQAKYVIHTACPVWNGGDEGEEVLLRRCYDSSLVLALEHGCRSIAFPLISAGHYRFPREKALQIAISAFSAFLHEHEMRIYLVVFDRASFKLSEKLFQNVASYIDENYADGRDATDLREACRPMLKKCRSSAPMAASIAASQQKDSSLEELLKQADAGFTETLLKLIDKTGKKDSEIYKKALLSKQHFSKIRNNPHYKPTKPTAIALALALELDLDDTRDLIGRAGYALTNSSKFDLIIRYFIQQGMYNLVEINCVLFEYDQPLLGS